MDYEKKYNEALERARKIHREIVNNEIIGFPGQIEEIFPELRESEDERVIRTLYYLVRDHDWLNGATQGEALAWLEKQKESLHISETYKENSDSFTDEDERIRKVIFKLLLGMREEIFTSQDEIVTKEKALAYLEKRPDIKIWPYPIKDAYLEQKEQKPAEWSEVELEFRGEKVTVKRPFFRDDKGRGYSTAELDEDVAWNALRAWCEKKGISLYDLYPKAEWSEEDADILNCCISSIEEAKENRYAYKETDGDTSYDREIDWLKSLRPSWKPSEEQMKVFQNTMQRLLQAGGTGKWYAILESLYEQLKKL